MRRSRTIGLACGLAAALVVAAVALGAAGDLDSSFGTNGTVIVPIGGTQTFGNGTRSAFAYDTTVQPDGKVVAAGFAYRTSGTTGGTAIALTRVTATGALDPSFNDDGKAYFDLGSESSARRVVLHDGYLYVAGVITNTAPNDWFVLRLGLDGKPDATWGGGDGFVSYQVGASREDLDQFSDLVVEADGSMLLVGTDGPGPTKAAIMRLDAAGAPVAAFGSGGLATLQINGGPTDGGSAWRLSDGTIVLAGSTQVSADARPFVAHLNGTTGAPVAAFGTNGSAILATPAGQSYSVSKAVPGPAGSILMATQRYLPDPSTGAVVRATAAGALDTSWGASGIRTVPGSDLLLSAVAQSDDKLLVVGTGTNEGLQQMEVPRLTADGAFDPTWSGDGIAWVSAGNPAQGGGVAVGPDTKVLVAGGTQDSGTLGMLIGRLHGDTTTPVVTPTPTAVATATPTPTSTPPKAVSPLDRFTLAKPTLRKLLGRKLKATAHCARACSLTLTLKASSSEARKRKLGRGAQVVAKGSARITKAGTLSVKLVAASRLRRKLARLHALTTTATLAVTDSTHSRFTSTRKIAFKH